MGCFLIVTMICIYHVVSPMHGFFSRNVPWCMTMRNSTVFSVERVMRYHGIFHEILDYVVGWPMDEMFTLASSGTME